MGFVKSKNSYFFFLKTKFLLFFQVELYEGILGQPCWLDSLSISYFASNNSYEGTKGVDIRPNDFGGLNGVNKLDHFDDPFGLTNYYQYIISQLERVGYKGGVTLFGAPYDWRVPADFLYHQEKSLGKVWGTLLKELIEKAFATSGNKAVNVITHSLGGPTFLYFLNRRMENNFMLAHFLLFCEPSLNEKQKKTETPEWKSKYVKSFIPIAAPWSGSPTALKSIVSGSNFGVQILCLNFPHKSLSHSFNFFSFV